MSLTIAVLWVGLGQAALLLVVLWLLPYLSREDFLFGVFVGVERDRLRATPTVFRIWNVGVATLAALVLATCAGLWGSGWPMASLAMPPVSVVLGGIALYLHCHNRSRHFGVRAPRVAVFPVVEIPIVREAVPLALQFLPWLIVLGIMTWTFLAWDRLPPGPRTGVSRLAVGPMIAFACLLLPLHLASWMVARPGAPLSDPGSGRVRERARLYRRAFAWYLWGLGMLMASVVAFVQWDAVRTLRGLRAGGRGPAVAALCVAVAALLGAILLAARLADGSGTGETERAEGGVPFHRRWVVGLFYFNPDDPAFLIHSPYGIGFTVNFGNRRALTIASGIVILVLSLTVLPLLILVL